MAGGKVTRSGLFILEKTGWRREAQRQRKGKSAEVKRDNANHGTTDVWGYPLGALHLIITAGPVQISLF